MSDFNSSHFRFKDIAGRQSGLLTAIKPIARNSHRQTVWECLCECGNTVELVGTNLTNGHYKSCGCTRTESVLRAKKELGYQMHGMAGSVEHKAWKAMWQRCTNPNDSGYRLYKDRAPPAEWKDFSVFFAHMGPRPPDKESIDRIDNNKPYGPGNCRWATRSVQNRNKSTTVKVVYMGAETGLRDLCDEMQVRYQRVYARIFKLGWSVASAVETTRLAPADANRRRAKRKI